MHPPFEQTQPNLSRWQQRDAEFIASNADWLARCERRLLESLPGLSAREAVDLASECSLDHYLRARSPEVVADDLVHSDIDPFARLDVDFR